MLDVENLSFGYDGGEPVLQDVSFSVMPGQLCGLFGPNGCGKTTLFKCCLRFLTARSGIIRISGQNLAEQRIQDIAKLVSYVPQEHASTFPFLVKDIVLMGRSPHLKGVFGASSHDKEIALNCMRVVGIEHFADKLYNQLSVGERQLVIIARALAQEAPVLFLDEPTSALDFSNQIRVWRLLKSITSHGKTVMACTHDPNHVIWFCDHVIVLGKKGIIASGPPIEIMSEKILDQVYKGVCNVKTCEQTKIVLPRD